MKIHDLAVKLLFTTTATTPYQDAELETTPIFTSL